jgi:hypothetical protein
VFYLAVVTAKASLKSCPKKFALIVDVKNMSIESDEVSQRLRFCSNLRGCRYLKSNTNFKRQSHGSIDVRTIGYNDFDIHFAGQYL